MKKKSEVYGVLDTQKEMDKAKGRQVVVSMHAYVFWQGRGGGKFYFRKVLML